MLFNALRGRWRFQNFISLGPESNRMMPLQLRSGWFQLMVLSMTLFLGAAIPIDMPRGTLFTSPLPTPTPAATLPLTLTLASRSSAPVLACDQPDLEYLRHVSASGSYTETESLASSPMVCQIKRDSCAYNRLFELENPSLVFNREEKEAGFGAEDSLIHPLMEGPLLRLNQLVQAEWGGEVQLRLTEAYDSLLQHDPPETEPALRYSLHYEGRAVDLTLWPIERELYGRLCALAHCAGFDYVENEVSHCHASIKAESLCEQCDPVTPVATPLIEAGALHPGSKHRPVSLPE